MNKELSTDAATILPVVGISSIWARLSLAAAVTSLASLAALHILSPEYDPSWRMVSEYALGSHGWALSLMFLSSAVSCAALFFAIRSHVPATAGKIGLGFLLAAGVGLGMAAFFDVSHDLHGLAAMIGIPSVPIAAMLISVSLIRTPAWSPARRLLLGTANLTWISLVLMFGSLFIAIEQSGGQEFGPGGVVGWMNRLYVVAMCGWVIAAAWRANRVVGKTS